MIKSSLSVVLISLSILGCTDRPAANRSLAPDPQSANLLGGISTKAMSFVSGSIVLVMLVDTEKQLMDGLCTGTVVADDLILTAAHCFEGKSDSSAENGFRAGRGVRISFGNFMDSTSPFVEGVKVSIHPGAQYDGEFLADFALIKIGQLPDGIKPLKIALDKFDIKKESVLQIAGYGPMDETDAHSRPDFHTNSVHIKENFEKMVQVHCRNFVRATDGDSGGPLLIKKGEQTLLLGVLSFTQGTWSGDHMKSCAFDAYFKISKEREWLNSAAAALGSPARF